MSLVATLCKWIATNLHTHIIWDRGEGSAVYLARHHRTEDFRDARVFLHNIRLPDHEVPHNHPYSWQFSFIAAGSYTEEYFEGCDCQGPLCYNHNHLNIIRRHVRWFNWIPNNRYHKIVQLHGDVWTLFIHGPKHGSSWFFWFPGIGPVHNEKFKETQERLDREHWAKQMEHTRYASIP